jgi:hypothetical protein
MTTMYRFGLNNKQLEMRFVVNSKLSAFVKNKAVTIKHNPEVPMLISVIVYEGHINVQLWDENMFERNYKILQCVWDDCFEKPIEECHAVVPF